MMFKNYPCWKHYRLVSVITFLWFSTLFPLFSVNNFSHILSNIISIQIITDSENLVAQKFPENGDPKGRRRGGTSRLYSSSVNA
ncbi:hypothetical protein [Brunnivagina elsteri]|uniref:hypothetical protein n=1 Tax=Brunnivagina elsteri TaxID=1247191 RepID=UPI0011784374|nr:hypothetical protein [Calothrix elsteri]